MGVLLDTLPDTQAAICVSDLSAFDALTECQRRGVTVPGQIAISGFGAYEIAGVSHPTITTIDPHPRLIGTEVANLILSLRSRANGSAPAPTTIKIGWNLRAAQST
jgi:LacI family gluconate utilization system Gnt-I transcriptional repressor